MPNLLVCLLLMSLPVEGAEDTTTQLRLPTVRANSDVVDVRFGDGAFLKGAWRLNPEFAPDVFKIGSKLPYGCQKVTFRSDVDEITFDVEAGNEYDVIFMLNGDTPCHTRIWARPDPAIWNQSILLPIFLGLLVFAVFLISKGKHLKPRPLLWYGLVAPLAFWLTTFVSASIRGDYDHFENVISQLGEVGSPAEVFTSLALLVVSAFCILFTIGFYKSSKRVGLSTVPSLMTLGFPVIASWAAVFPLRNELHGLVDPLGLLAVNLGALLSFIFWRNRRGLLTVSRWSLIGFVMMMLILPLLASGLPQQYDGLVQRTWYLGWSVWFVALSFGLRSLTADDNLVTPAS